MEVFSSGIKCITITRKASDKLPPKINKET